MTSTAQGDQGEGPKPETERPRPQKWFLTSRKGAIRAHLPWMGAALAAALLPGVISCRCEDEHPYTPFSVTDSLPQDPALRPPNPQILPDTSGAERLEPPPGTKRWEVLGKVLEAPPGLVFGSLVRLGPVGFVWLGPEKPGSTEGAGVYRVQETGALERFYEVPAFLPRGGDCGLEAGLALTGSSSLALDVRAPCQNARLGGTPSRAAILLDSLAQSPPFGMRLENAAPGETLEVKMDARDADGDGRDDRTFEFHLKSPTGGDGALTFAWLSRAAGPSRRSETPGKGLAEQVQTLGRKAIRKKERAEVPPQVDALRRAFGAICAEGKRPRVTLLDETNLRCGDLNRSLGQLQMAQIEANLGLERPFVALGEYLHSGYFGAPASERERDAMKAAILKKIPSVTGVELSSITGPFPETAWLSFDQSSRLWLHDGTHERVVWPMAESPPPEEETAEPGVARTIAPDPRVGPGGTRVVAALPSCDRSEVTLMMDAQGNPLPPIPLSILAPRPGNCDRFGSGPLAARALEFSGGDAIVLVDGEPISTTGRPIQFREPKAWHTKLGLIVVRDQKPEIWATGREWLSQECAVSRDTSRVACLQNRAVTLFHRTDAAATPPSQ
jgi:hypothetical protein